MPYLPEYFAIREAKPLLRVIRRYLKNCPKIDLIFVDANGKWHSRGLFFVIYYLFLIFLCFFCLILKNFYC